MSLFFVKLTINGCVWLEIDNFSYPHLKKMIA